MNNTELIKKILSESLIKEKFKISQSDLDSLNGDSRYQKQVVKVVKEIVADNENHISATKSYNKLKNILNIT